MADEDSNSLRISYLGEGIHAGLRKLCDSPESLLAFNAIQQMPKDEWWGLLKAVWAEAVQPYLVEQDDTSVAEVTTYVRACATNYRKRADMEGGSLHPDAARWKWTWIDRAEGAERLAARIEDAEHKKENQEPPEFWTGYGEHSAKWCLHSWAYNHANMERVCTSCGEKSHV